MLYQQARRPFWRRHPVVTGAVAYFVTSQQPKIYEATALVRIQQKITTANDAFGSLELGTRLAQTYAREGKQREAKEVEKHLARAWSGNRKILDLKQL